jgi:hypothetical protein
MMSSSDSNDPHGGRRVHQHEYAVGYGKPPKHTRFKPGQSGNPSGRPKGSRSLGAELNTVLARKIPVRENGQTKHMTILQAILFTAAKTAIGGDHRARQDIFAVYRQFELEERSKDSGFDQCVTLADEDSAIINDFLERQRKHADKDDG